MYRERIIGVVVPAYNEEGFVGDVIEGIPSFVDRIYVIDDCSTDGTWDEIITSAETAATARATDGGTETDTALRGPNGVAGGTALDGPDGDTPRTTLFERAHVHDPIGRIVPIRHERNRGAGGAIKTGYLAVLEDDMAVDIAATIDADGQMDSRLLPRFLDPIVESVADYTKGNRLLDREARQEMPAFRLFGNAILTYLTKIASGYWKTMDPQNGYTAISVAVLSAVDVEAMYEYYGYCTDLLIKLNVGRARVADVAMPARYGDETSSIKYEEYITKVSILLLRGFLWRVKTRYLLLDFHPLVLLYGVGAFTAGSGVAEGVVALRNALSTERSRRSRPGPRFGSFSRGVLTFLVGCTLLVLSMIFDMETNDGLETQIRE